MATHKHKEKGVKFVITREMIREFRKVSPEARLAWLHELNVLSVLALTPERRKIWEKFRNGEL